MAFPEAPDFEGLLARVTDGLGAAGLDFMLIGGQAVLLHGEPRLTQDVDVTLGASPDSLHQVLTACKDMRLTPLPEDVVGFVRETFVLPVSDRATGIRVDLIFSTTPYEAMAIQRAVRVDIRGRSVPFASAEDLILHKLFAGRPRDLEDVRGVVARQRESLDWGYLHHWADEFASVPGREGMPGILTELGSPRKSGQ